MGERIGGTATIDVLVVEDSRVIQDYLVYILETDPQIRVCGAVASGEEALACAGELRPDVILMDIHLPGIDGLETTRRIMSSNPIPIVVCTASTSFDQIDTAMRVLEAGALAILKKPRSLDDPGAEAEAAAIISALKSMSEVKLVKRWNHGPAVSQDPILPIPTNNSYRDSAIVAIGASTGGPPALMALLSNLPPNFPLPILVVQHIAAGFTAGLVEWLGSATRLKVQLAIGGEIPVAGHVYLAPDNLQLRIGVAGELLTSMDPPLNGLRPSVGALFRSVAERYANRAIGVLLTGMGRDGADELKTMADRGALTIAQDEASSVVFGMPAEAIKLGAAQFVLPPQAIAAFLATTLGCGERKGDAPNA
ncbi:MAG TPA: chemotaxis-specific protein-glutamate methyltransferase CheB [Rectinemataceae bacterium]|nr:chemotaxis-specific protein-glutamate methyltransferase CheB [Rectinemataceae bacterium]